MPDSANKEEIEELKEVRRSLAPFQPDMTIDFFDEFVYLFTTIFFCHPLLVITQDNKLTLLRNVAALNKPFYITSPC